MIVFINLLSINLTHNMQIKEEESRDSIRIVWNVMASNRVLQAKASVPQALHYTPLHQRQQMILDHLPPKCQKCDSYMNPYNRIHINKSEFTCCICKSLNKFPPNYFNKQSEYPPEMTLNYSSFVITQNSHPYKKMMGYIFVVDTCVQQKELQVVKQQILNVVSNLEDNCNVGLISFNKYVSIFDLTSSPVKVHQFSPYQEYETVDFMRMLEIQVGQEGKRTSRFINPLRECRSTFEKRVKSLKKIKHPSYKHQREFRATGQALNLALSVNELTHDISKIVFFCGGPCTIGAGKVIEVDYKMEMRPIKQQTPKLSKTAKQYFSKLALKARNKQISIDSFIFSVEEAGFAEMSELLTSTGGLLVQHEEFDSNIFRESFRKAYQGLQEYPPVETAAFSSIIVKCSDQIVISQNFLHKIATKENSSLVVIGGMDEDRTLTLQYELADLSTDSEAYYIQIKTLYRYPQNLSIKFQRVTTIRRLFSNFVGDLAAGFDQGAALAFLAKLSISRSLQEPSSQVRQWLDNMLCKWAATFGQYRTGDPLSFKLAQNIRSFPQFVYNIRRNPIIRRSGISLDQFAYISSIVKHQSVENIILIVQPALLEYTPEHNSMHPIPLDEKYMKPESILVLDSFFNVVEWHGQHIKTLIQQKEYEHSQHIDLANLFKNVKQDIQSLKNDRFPVPHYYLTHSGGSKERFIKSRLSSREHEQGQLNLSDEVDVAAFTEKLIELVVNKQL